MLYFHIEDANMCNV